MEENKKYSVKDYKTPYNPKWCPGCGDYAVIASMQKAMSELGLSPENTVVVSGIGCSSRLPYYMNTYGFHTIHGRGAAIATGIKIANPHLSVWLATGDGDSLAIGGNHFIHVLRRNVDINIILMNNKIYGLTKGQYSPTSDRGFISKSSPYGTVEDPFNPAELAIGARGTFFARTIDSDIKNSAEIMIGAAKHKGASVVEVLLNCVIFNDGIYKNITGKENREDKTIFLKQGEKMLFGKKKEKGLVFDGLGLKAVNIDSGKYSIDDVLVHDASQRDPGLHFRLSLMNGEHLPLALGIIRNVDAPTYENEIEKQIKEIQLKNPVRTLKDLLLSGNTWEIK